MTTPRWSRWGGVAAAALCVAACSEGAGIVGGGAEDVPAGWVPGAEVPGLALDATGATEGGEPDAGGPPDAAEDGAPAGPDEELPQGDTASPCECHDDGDCASPGLGCLIARCDEETCRCTLDPLPDGTPCGGEDLCLLGQRCTGGVCAEGTPRACPPPAQGACRVSHCQPGSGLCAVVPLPDGTLCDDKDPCTEGDRCLGGMCEGAPEVCCAEAGCTTTCCVVHATAGCDVSALEACVCREDSKCCAVTWDSICVHLAATVCGGCGG